MEALLIKNDAWDYVSGIKPKPEIVEGNAASRLEYDAWIKGDRKAKSDIVLSISANELKQVKGCTTSRDVWLCLEKIYQSKGPARKATLLKQLILQRMKKDEDVREHLRKFFDAVDKLAEMDVTINADLLAILLLYSLPSNFENFRCAIESRDDLPSPEVLRVKIIEESEARKHDARSDIENALVAKKQSYRERKAAKKDSSTNKADIKVKCFRCRKIGHKSSECRSNDGKTEQNAKAAENFLFYGKISSCAADNGVRDVAQAAYSNRDRAWCLDSGCSSHLCKNRDDFSEVCVTESERLHLANNASTDVKARGNVNVVVDQGRGVKTVKLSDALFVPDLRTNLLSVGKITDKGYRVIFEKDSAEILDDKGNTLLVAKREDGLYYIKTKREDECAANAMSQSAIKNSVSLWHRRMGHLNTKDLVRAAKTGIIEGVKFTESEAELSCDVCIQGKMSRASFPKHSDRSSDILEIVHSDVCGPMRTESHGKAKYFVTFIDDHSGWCEVRFLNKKSGVFTEFKKVHTFFEKQKGVPLKCLQSDNGTEYLSNEFKEYTNTHGIQRRLTVANNPEQNGKAERRNRTLVEMARCLLIQAGLPTSFWAEAIATANFIRNRCPSKSLEGKTPHEVWHGSKPNVSGLKEFGCRVFVLDRISRKGKFENKTKNGVFLGYSEQSKAYRVWIPSEHKVETTRDVKFLEDTSPLTVIVTESPPGSIEVSKEPLETSHESSTLDPSSTSIQTSSEDLIKEEDMESIHSQEESIGDDNDEAEIQRRGPGRPRLIRTGRRGRPRKQYSVAEAKVVQEEVFLTEIPIMQAVASSDSSEWYDAMATELKSVIANDTWDLVDRPAGQLVIGSRMVLRNKFGADGSLERRKARIVARGFSQRPGIDFLETFAPVARLSSIRLATAIASQFDMHIRQFDVTAAYLNGTLDEEIFMEVPKLTEETLELIIRNEHKESHVKKKAQAMLEDLKKGNKVCRLKKALYGLRQAGRQWNRRLDQELQRLGLKPLNSDPCVYLRGQGGDLLMGVVYVDDILLISRKLDDIAKIKEGLLKSFDVKDLGDVKCCLGIEFIRNKNGYSIYQSGFIQDVLARFEMSDCKPISTPMDANAKLSRNSTSENESCSKMPYRELVGSLMYIAMGTRPDIAHVVSCLSCFNDCYQQAHWVAAKRVLRYLKGTLNYGILYNSSRDKPLVGYVDADWGNCPDDRRSYTGYAFMLASGVISWESRKQRTVALSSTEAEYMGITDAVKEAVYLRRFLKELGFDSLTNVTILCDNIGAQKLASNPVFHSRTKHIDIRHHYVREVLSAGLVNLEYTPTEDMAADVLTKGLPRVKHLRCSQTLGIKHLSA